MSLIDKHNELIAQMPEGVTHDNCDICNDLHDVANNTNTKTISPEGGDMKTYSEEDFTTAVREAVAPLQAAADAKVAELQAQLDLVHAAKADEDVAVKVAEIQSELDKSELRATEAERKYADLVAALEAADAEAKELAAREARREERLIAVKEVAAFKDDYLEANIDRWVAMDDEVFAAVLEDWKAVSTVVPAEKSNEEISSIPAETAMSTVRNEGTKNQSTAAKVFAARNAGIDVRNITN